MALPFFSRPYLVYPKFMPTFDVSTIIADNLKAEKLQYCVCVVIKSDRSHVPNLAISFELFHYRHKP
jgi:hypothetical protein